MRGSSVGIQPKKIELGSREKAMLTLAQYASKEEYLRALAGNELRHPVLTSLRVHVKKSIKSESGSDITTVVVEAEGLQYRTLREHLEGLGGE